MIPKKLLGPSYYLHQNPKNTRILLSPRLHKAKETDPGVIMGQCYQLNFLDSDEMLDEGRF